MNRTYKKYLRSTTLLLMIISITIFSAPPLKPKVIYASQTIQTVTYDSFDDTLLEHRLTILVDKPSSSEVIKQEPEDPYKIIDSYINEICDKYKLVEPELVKSIIYHESRYNPKATNGRCVGLMQVSTRWHEKRATKLGVTDFYDPYSNILLGVDYLSEMISEYKDPALVLMFYNMKHNTAIDMYKHGKISKYAKSVLAMAESFKEGE